MATRARVVAPFALAALSAAAALSLARVFDSGRFVLPVLGAAVVPHAVGALTRRRRWAAAVWLAIAVGALSAYVVWVLVPSSTWYGVPTSSTADLLGRQLRGGLHILRTVPAPIPATAGTRLLAVLATWTMATVADRLAFARHTTLAGIAPALVLFVSTSTLGTSEYRIEAIAGFAVASGVFLVVQNIAVLDRHRTWLVSSQPTRAHWLVPAALLGIGALVTGLVVAPALPGAHGDPIIDLANAGPRHRSGRSYSTTVPPLIDVSAKLEEADNRELFTVRAAQPDYWRLTALDDFTTDGGGQWTLSAEGGDQVRDQLPEQSTDGTVRQTYDIGSLGERWLPAAYRPVAASTPALMVISSGTLVSGHSTVEGLHYTVDSRLPPSPASVTRQQQDATARPVPARLRQYTALPSGLPSRITDQARGVVSGATSPYQQAAALRDYFRANFAYDVSVGSGDDTNAIVNFLDTRRGFCVQFASAYAVMARSLGIPARVAVGFTQGDPVDGVYHVRSHNAHAWPEIWLAGLGWTHLFDPTPSADGHAPGGSTLPGDTSTNTVTATTVPTATTLVAGGNSPASQGSSPQGGGTDSRPAASTPAAAPPRVSATEPGGGFDVWILVLAVAAVVLAIAAGYVAIIVGAKSRRRARRRGADEPAAAVQGAWDEAIDRLREARVPPDPALTPLELARRASPHPAPAATQPLRTLARAYTVVRYSGELTSAGDAQRAWASVDELDRALDAGITRRERWRRRLDPATLRSRAGRSGTEPAPRSGTEPAPRSGARH
jgi:transglutaminase-like putative cysteine protease